MHLLSAIPMHDNKVDIVEFGTTVMTKAYTVCVQNHFFGNKYGKSEPIGAKFYRRHRVTWHVPCKSLTPFAKPARNGAEKTAFCELFCHGNNASFHPLPGRWFPRNFNTKRESVSSWKLSEQSFKIFPKRGHFPRKKLILGVLVVHLRGARSSLGL